MAPYVRSRQGRWTIGANDGPMYENEAIIPSGMGPSKFASARGSAAFAFGFLGDEVVQDE